MTNAEERNGLSRRRSGQHLALLGVAIGLLLGVAIVIAILAQLIFWRAANRLPAILASATPSPEPPASATPSPTPEPSPTPALLVESPTPTATQVTPEPSPTPEPTPFTEGPTVYGYSYSGLPLSYYRFGTGPSVRLIVGGIHGGYEWNTVALVNDMVGYLTDHPELIPDTVTLYVVPNMNPDGVEAGTDAVVARMNGNLVDLNRNWDYQWQPNATHGTRPVSAGADAFSEPETRATRDFMLDRGVSMVIFYHSAMGVVFSGADREHSLTEELTTMLSDATGYPHQEYGIPGQITTGDAIDWASTQGIAGTEVELTTHAAVTPEEWQQNLEGLKAFLRWTPPVEPPATPDTPDLQAGTVITYIVGPGDTLSGIAEMYGISSEALQLLNGIDNPNEIWEGQSLIIRLPPTPGVNDVP